MFSELTQNMVISFTSKPVRNFTLELESLPVAFMALNIDGSDQRLHHHHHHQRLRSEVNVERLERDKTS